jgi:hypothetical protein
MGDKVVLLVPKLQTLALCILQQIIDCHVKDFGLDAMTGPPLQPALIPLCRLVHMEYVQSVSKVSEAIESLKREI